MDFSFLLFVLLDSFECNGGWCQKPGSLSNGTICCSCSTKKTQSFYFLGIGREKVETWNWRRTSDDTFEAKSDSRKLKAWLEFQEPVLCFYSIQYQLSVVSNLTSLSLRPAESELHWNLNTLWIVYVLLVY